MVIIFMVVLLPAGGYGQTRYPRPETYIPTWATLEKYKKFYDDPRPYLKDFGLKDILPRDFYKKLVFDQGKMKDTWAEIVGFKAPDVVGKLYPEIKPGKYTYRDVALNPAFKKLFIPEIYDRIGPTSPTFAGRIQEFEIVPTRQYYWALPIAEMTKRNMGKSRLDAKGYLVENSWEGGFPFPRPSGQFKAQQVMYNIEKNVYYNFNQNAYFTTLLIGYNGGKRIDFQGKFFVRHMVLTGRALMEPIGYFDGRAKQLGELDTAVIIYSQPRDMAGQVLQQTRYLDRDRPDQNLVYIPAFRRVRRMSGTDTQDAIGGQDVIYDDNGGWAQKLTPSRYPYKFEIIDEREYLTFANSTDGSETVDGKTYDFKGVRFERRPLYVVRLTQMDKNYVYSQRILYVDKEHLITVHISNYDQKGRLYRTFTSPYGWFPEAGMLAWWGIPSLAMDHVDKHSTIEVPWNIPAVWDRDDMRISGGQGAK